MRWKWIIGLVGLVIVVLIGVLYVIVTTYDFNKSNPRSSRRSRGHRPGADPGRGLQGALRALSLRLGGRCGPPKRPLGVAAGNGQDERAGDQVSLLPLIRGEVEFKRLILREPDLLIETDSAGRSNLEFNRRRNPGRERRRRKGRPRFLL